MNAAERLLSRFCLWLSEKFYQGGFLLSDLGHWLKTLAGPQTSWSGHHSDPDDRQATVVVPSFEGVEHEFRFLLGKSAQAQFTDEFFDSKLEELKFRQNGVWWKLHRQAGRATVWIQSIDGIAWFPANPPGRRHNRVRDDSFFLKNVDSPVASRRW